MLKLKSLQNHELSQASWKALVAEFMIWDGFWFAIQRHYLIAFAGGMAEKVSR